MEKQQVHTENADQRAIAEAVKNPQAFELLYKKYHERVFRFIYLRLDDPDVAADITSDVFVKAMLALPKYKYKGYSFSTWLFRIASNAMVDYFRANAKMRTVNIDDVSVSSISDEIGREFAADAERLIPLCLAELPEQDLMVIELRFFENKSFREIGDITGITEANAKVRTYRVLDKLRKIISKHIES
ncbi:MAG: sigma-70 family RNA polymerase sigma factor [Bacteroidetes bacterium]|nr:sigma-70 family RNA polymerase sigma factor [Bacteroidota bacterium]